MELFRPDTKFNFLKHRRWFLGLSFISILISLGLLFTQGLNYGIDFRGGAELQYQFSQPVSIEDIRSALKNSGKGEATVQKVQESDAHEYILSFRIDEGRTTSPATEITPLLTQAFPNNPITLRKVDSVGPRVGADLKKAAILSMIYAMLLILGYLWFRFNITFSPAAVVALFHDVTVTVGVLILLQVEFNLSVVAALLTIVGYSLNDTIVIFDRVRDNLVHLGKLSLEHILDRSINECMNRTILTSLTTLLVVVILIFLGGPTLYPFAVTLAIGIVAGTYSTVYIASPIVLWLDNWMTSRKEIRNPARAK